MIELPEEVEQDILNFMKKFNNMGTHDLKESLRFLLAKHLQIMDSDFLLTKFNLVNIDSSAKTNYTNLPSVVYLDGLEEKNKLSQGYGSNDDQLRLLCISEAVISELRKEKVLGRPVKFNLKTR